MGVTFNSVASCVMTMNGTSSISVGQDVLLGNSGSKGTLVMNQSSSITGTTAGYFGNDNGNGGCVGNATLNDASSYTITAGPIYIGNSDATGIVTLNGTATMTAGGAGGNVYIGNGGDVLGASAGTVTLNGTATMQSGNILIYW